AQMTAYRDDLEAVRVRLENEGVAAEIHELVRGNTPADDLIAVAESTGAQLIVIGLRRRSPVGKVVLGSNAQDLLLRASCPVLAVKAS
ncbi:MAG: universal stress protein, partial [Actinomycetota bacterium]|nr:universal stress protein [Actinomycetota bacterium]